MTTNKKIVLIIIVVILASCGLLVMLTALFPTSDETRAARVTNTPRPTNTPRATATDRPTATARPTNTPKPDVGDDYSAALMCQKFVTDKLVAPSTAKFPALRDQRIEEYNETTWIVWAYVDAQNRFGATIRTRYWCEVEYIGNDMWRLIDIDLYE
jgi:hypothetical protein